MNENDKDKNKITSKIEIARQAEKKTIEQNYTKTIFLMRIYNYNRYYTD